MSIQKTHLSRFRSIRGPDHGDPHTLPNDRLRILWVLSVVNEDQDFGYLTPAQVSDVLCDLEGIAVPRQRSAAILEKERSTVARKRTGGRVTYKIMRSGLDELVPSEMSSMYIDPEAALTAIRRLEDTLAGLEGVLSVCDPYIENRTLDFLAECKAAKQIRLLTTNILKESTLRRDLAAYQREHSIDLDIRIHSGLHDRYIIHSGGMHLLGTSLNGFAKKQSFIVNMGPDIAAITSAAFAKLWGNATKFG